MKILLTGDFGMIGTRLKEFWTNKHDLEFLDIQNGKDLRHCDLNYEVDLVLHLAGKSGVRKSLEDMNSYWRHNVETFQRLIEAFPNTRIIYASSSTAKEPFRNPYAYTKYVMESIAPKNSLGLRFTTVYGSDKREQMFIPKLLRKEIEYINNHRRDFIHVDDVVSAIDLLTQTNLCGVIDVGTGTSNSIKDLVDIVYGKNSFQIQECDWHERIDNIASPKELEELGWSPKHNIKSWLTKAKKESNINNS
jgi:nucleoside-diphosphate-sugar epimerase